jgi:hypothetical protein
MRNGIVKLKNGKFRVDVIRAMKSKFLGVFDTKELAEHALLVDLTSPRIVSKGIPYKKIK